MPKYSVLIARFPYGGTEHSTVTDWMVTTVCTMKGDPRIGEIRQLPINDTPITMTRNRACRVAQQLGIDLILMVDSDMKPDLPIAGMKPFWDSSLDFVLAHQGPCLVAAPYCGPPPHENVFIFRWANYQNDCPDADFRLTQYTREEAAIRGGFEEVAALPTGVILFPTKVLDRLTPPWFEYEYTDEYRTHKSTTEDVYFTRNASLSGIPVYCNWDAWAGHWKAKCVQKPAPMTRERVGVELHKALARGPADEKLIDVRSGGI